MILNRALLTVLIFSIVAASTAFASQTRKPAQKTPAKKSAATEKKASAAKALSKTPAKRSAAADPKKKTPAKTAKAETNKKPAPPSKNAKAKTTTKNTAATKASSKKPAEKSSATSAKSKAKTPPTTAKTASSKPTAKKPTTSRSTAKAPEKTAAVQKTTRTSVPAPKSTLNRVIVSSGKIEARSTDSNDAPNIETIPFGTPLKVYETRGDWSHVGPDKGSAPTGWIKTSATAPLTSAKENANVYRAVAAGRLAEDIDFSELSDVVEFLGRSASTVSAPNDKAGLLLDRLLAMRTALNTVPHSSSDKEPYKSFLAKHESELVYSDPSAEYFVNSNEFWQLHESYKSLAIGEEIAWQAAQNPIPGECEGYVNCYLYVLRVTYGEYLNFYPSGRYSELALSQIEAMLEPLARDAAEKTVYTGPSDISDRASFNQQLSELRKIISNTQIIEKNRPLAQIQKIADGYR